MTWGQALSTEGLSSVVCTLRAAVQTCFTSCRWCVTSSTATISGIASFRCVSSAILRSMPYHRTVWEGCMSVLVGVENDHEVPHATVMARDKG